MKTILFSELINFNRKDLKVLRFRFENETTVYRVFDTYSTLTDNYLILADDKYPAYVRVYSVNNSRRLSEKIELL